MKISLHYDVDHKPHPNHQIYIQALRRMSPEQRLMKAFELTEFSKALFIQGLRKLHPELSPREFHELLLTRLDKCHNRNY